MSTIESTSRGLDQPGPPFTLSEDQPAAAASWPATAVGPGRRTDTTSAACSTGSPITA